MDYILCRERTSLEAERDGSLETSRRREAFAGPWRLARGKFQAKGRVKTNTKNEGESKMP